MSVETRKVAIQDAELRILHDDHGTRSLEGYAAKFGVLSHELPGKFRERIDKRAFDRISTADVRAVIDHDGARLLGRTKSGTLRLTVDERGLRYAVPSLPDTSYARDLEEQIKRGDVDGCSFAFRCKKDSWTVEDGVSVRTLLDVDLIDVCPTAAPCYPDTEVALRSMTEWQGTIDKAQQSIYDANRASMDAFALDRDHADMADLHGRMASKAKTPEAKEAHQKAKDAHLKAASFDKSQTDGRSLRKAKQRLRELSIS